MIQNRRMPRLARRRSLPALPEAALFGRLPRSPNVVVLVDGVRQGTIRALGYGAGLATRRLTGVHIRVDERRASRVEKEWERRLPGLLLTVIDSGGRSLGEALRPMVEVEAATDGPVVVVVPEPRKVVVPALTTDPSLEIVNYLHDIPNTWVVMLAG